MKQIIKQLLAVVILLSATLCGYAYEFEADGIYYIRNGKSVYVTYYSSNGNYNCAAYSGSIEIPSTVKYNGETYSVTAIGKYAFQHCSGLTSVTIPNSVTSIGDYAFQYCSGLTSVTIPNSVTSIGILAFSDCGGLTSVVFNAENCTTMGPSHPVFTKCTNLTSLTIGDKVNTIPSYAFQYCSGLTSVTIPNSVTSIGDNAFSDCSGLASVTIGNSVTSIGNNAFSNCSGLASVTIGNSVTSIGDNAFNNCSGLTKVELSDIAAWCNIVFINPLSNPLYYAKHLYLNGSEVINLVIPNSVTSIGDYAFQYCSELTSVTIPNSVTSIGDYAFSGCSSISILKWNVIEYPDFTTTAFPDSPLTSVVISDDVVSVPNNLCKGITTINQVSIGKNVETIGKDSFSGCTGIKTITWKPINYTGKLPFPSTISPTQFSFGNAVETIPDYLCYDYSEITSITIPASVKTIGDMAFSGCNLTKVTCRATLPPTIIETTFSQSTYDEATLYVYANSEDYYRDDEYWQNFYNVQTLSGGTVIEPVQLAVLFPDRGKVAIDVPYNKAVTLTVFPNDVAGCGLSSATFNGADILDELDENYRYTTPVLTENAVLSVVYVSLPSGVDQSLANRIKVSASNGTVRVMGAAPESEVLVCDLSGKIVRQSTEKTFTLGEGIYVLTVEGLLFKFAM